MDIAGPESSIHSILVISKEGPKKGYSVAFEIVMYFSLLSILMDSQRNLLKSQQPLFIFCHSVKKCFVAPSLPNLFFNVPSLEGFKSTILYTRAPPVFLISSVNWFYK